MSMNNYRTLILSPHVDDEVLGCYSFLSKTTYVLYFGVESRPNISRQKRIQELKVVANTIGFHWDILGNEVNKYQVSDLISSMESIINRLQPNTVLLPEPSYNQDHRAVYDAGVVATRPHDTNWFVPNVFIFEQPHSVMWPHSFSQPPTYFNQINIDSKLYAYSLYKSQIRGHRSPKTVRALARLRGSQICVSHAEAFHVKRLVGSANFDGFSQKDYDSGKS